MAYQLESVDLEASIFHPCDLNNPICHLHLILPFKHLQRSIWKPELLERTRNGTILLDEIKQIVINHILLFLVINSAKTIFFITFWDRTFVFPRKPLRDVQLRQVFFHTM